MQALCWALGSVALVVLSLGEEEVMSPSAKFSIVIQSGASGVASDGDLLLAVYPSGAFRSLGGGELTDRQLKKAMQKAGTPKSGVLIVSLTLQVEKETSVPTLAAALSRLRRLAPTTRDTKVVLCFKGFK